MKKRNNAFARLVGLLLVSATVLTLTVAATGGAGTSSDPLVTLSYLNEKFLPQILSEVDKKTASREQTLSSKLTEQVKSETQAFEQKYGASSGNTSGGTAMSFTVITLNQGQILYMGVGCEAMLRTGSGVCVAANVQNGKRIILFIKPPVFETLWDFFVSAGTAAGHSMRWPAAVGNL